MNLSFYSASVSADGAQARLGVLANDIANVNTYGYKAMTPSFVDLLYTNMNENNEAANAGEQEVQAEQEEGQQPAPATEISDNIKNGVGTRLEKTDIDFSQSARVETRLPLDFAIDGDGFFAVLDPGTQQIKYTRCGSFALSAMQTENTQAQQNTEDGAAPDIPLRLVDGEGNFVLDQQQNPIVIYGGYSAIELTQADRLNIGVFDFPVRDGMRKTGENYYLTDARNGEPAIAEDSKIVKGHLETSNVDIARTFTKVIETQKAYQMMLKMIQTTDDIEAMINSMR